MQFIFFGSFIIFLYYYKLIKENFTKKILFFILSTIIILTCFHKVKIINFLYCEIKLSDLSPAYKMHFNFDKFLYSWVLCIIIGRKKFINFNYSFSDIKKILKHLSLSLLIIPIGYFLNFLEFDFKINKYLIAFIINNIFFIGFSEEVFFRGFIFKELEDIFKKHSKLPLFLSNLIFAIIHLPNIPFSILAFLMGIIYTKVYQIKNSIIGSIFIHSTVNIIHFIFFTYPHKIL